MAKRGRKKAGEKAGAGQSSTDVICPYWEDYSGRRWWLLGIKIDTERGQLPCHSHVCGGINWQQGSQRQVETDGWAALDDHRNRVMKALYSFEQIRQAVSAVKNFVVRWERHSHQTPKGQSEGYATKIISLENRHKVRDAKTREFRGSGYRYQPSPDDVPLAQYLVLFPRRMLETRRGFLPLIGELPTMLDLDPGLRPDRLKAITMDESWEDEPW